MKPFTKKIVLENGREFYGYGFGANREAIHEIVYNTSMAGYQEMISDPSYTNQMVVMTYPLIGNYGLTDDDYESRSLTIGGLIVREYNDTPSNFRYTRTLNEVLEEQGIPAISGIDTRFLTRIIREGDCQKVMITDADTPLEEALQRLKQTTLPMDLVKKVSCKKRWFSRTPNHRYDVVAIDCGIKNGIIRCLNQRGCNVTVVPYNATVEEIMAFHPNGVLVSNGPGDPKAAKEVIQTVERIKGQLPMFAIGLGMQIVALACGAKTVKMKCGHRGSEAVRCLESGRIMMTAQSHGYMVDEESLKDTCLKVTHRNVADKTVQGVASQQKKMFAVQFNPESGAGPQDAMNLFDEFIKMMEEEKNA